MHPATTAAKAPGDDKRKRKLDQMRESQKKLKQRRQKEMDRLQDEVARLRQELAMSETKAKMVDEEYTSFVSMIINNGDLTVGQLLRVLERGRLGPSLQDESQYVPLAEVAADYDIEHYPYLWNDQQEFILKQTGKQFLKCIHTDLDNTSKGAKVHPVRQQMFKFIGLYGISLMGTYYEQTVKVVKDELVPKKWLTKERVIPEGYLGLAEMMDNLAHNFKAELMILGVLLAFMARHSTASLFGPLILEEDMKICMSLSLSANFDLAYILGTLDEELCTYDYLKELKEARAAA